MISKPLFAILMVALLLGFGNSCICVTEPLPPDKGTVDQPPSPPSSLGCQQPIYSQGQPGPDEYTIVVGVFRSNARALGLAQKLRGNNIHNYCYQQSNGCWVVSVGRYWDAKSAQKMLNKLVVEFGYSKAMMRKPGDLDIECHEYY